jgi:adenylate cyclase
MNATLLASGIAVVELGGIIALGVLLIVSRHQLKETRSELERARQPRIAGRQRHWRHRP